MLVLKIHPFRSISQHDATRQGRRWGYAPRSFGTKRFPRPTQIRSAGHNSTQKQGNANFHVPHPLHAFEFDGNMYLLYNGNQFGRFGFGLAVSTL